MERILDEIDQVSRIGIGGHIRPDGDCIGSAMGLWLYLKKMLPNSVIQVYLEKPAEIFQIIEGVDEIQHDINTDEQLDVFIVLDCEPNRLGFSELLFQKAKKTIQIDHHISSKGSADIVYIKPDASSTSELIYDLLDKEQLDIEIAKALYIGMIHDTGVFQYSNTSKKTLLAAAHLIEFSFDFTSIIEETFYQRTLEQSRLVGKALMECELQLDNRVITYCISKQELLSFHAGNKDLEGIVNQMRMVKGVDCAVFCYELSDGEYKFSLRSNQHVNVSIIATLFGGGGHVRAAGCSVVGDYKTTMEQILSQIKLQLS